MSSVAIGALAAVPFQKANIFSRARYRPAQSYSTMVVGRVAWTSHLGRRGIFTVILPMAGVMYAIFSFGPPVRVAFPCLFAGLVGFLSCLAMAECNGLLMETWDCSDLQPGMTGRRKNPKNAKQRINYSSFPQVTAGYAVVHSLGFVFAAGATGISGMAQRNLGQRAATAVVASILFFLTLLLLGVLARFRHVPIIPRSRSGEMDIWTAERRRSSERRAPAIAAAKAKGLWDSGGVLKEDVGWRPLIIGNPLEKTRCMNVLELGALTRWSEIRRKNQLIDQGTHLNRQALELACNELEQRGTDVLDDLQRGRAVVSDLVRKVSKRSMRSLGSRGTSSKDSRVGNHDAGAIGPPGAGLGHSHTPYPAEAFLERHVLGQTLEEEAEELDLESGPELLSGSEAEIDDYARSRSQDHASHQAPKIQPYAGFEQQEVLGGTPWQGGRTDAVDGDCDSVSEAARPAHLGSTK